MARKLLVVIDPDRKDQPALDRALEIASLTEISLHVVLFTESGENDAVGAEAADDRRNGLLEQLVDPYRKTGVVITTELRPFRRLYEAIIQVALEEDVYMVFKPTRHHSVFRQVLFNSTDWNLIRLCPFPLLLVSDSAPIRGRDIVAAVEVGGEDEDHAELNRLLLSQATTIARLLESRVQVVNAVHYPAGLLAYSAGEVPNIPMSRDLEKDHLRRGRELAAHFDIPPDQVTVRDGPPEEVVNNLADSFRASVIILGTVARSGLAGLFIGNTAERVLEESKTDVLVIKQSDFQSPIQAGRNA